MEYVYIILSWVFQTIRYIIIGEPLAFRIKVLTYTIRAIPNLNFSSREKKYGLYLCIFFPLSQKKLTRFSDLNEWMTNVHALWKKKVPLVLGWYIFYFSTFTTVIYLHAAMRMVMKPFYCFLSSFWQIASYFFFRNDTKKWSVLRFYWNCVKTYRLVYLIVPLSMAL